jgi:glyoxylase-like metal-dependent hydrolase (beta-lactamase superfamily II)
MAKSMKRLPAGQVAGVYRRNVGDIAVATVNDGMVPTDFSHIVGADPAICEAAHRTAGRPTPPWLTIDTYLIESADRLLLVDAGYADITPNAGRLLPNLAALGVKPIDVDAVLMTHLHADHDAGLIDRDGAAVFPKAELVVHEDELVFWRDESNIARLSEGQKPDFALATRVLAAYADRLRPVRSGEVEPGVSVHPTPGHTPGHTAWRIASGSDQLLIWGDVIHLPGIQFAIPDASVIYDLDSRAAAVARRRVLDIVSADRIPVAGVHLDFPGYGLVTVDTNGRYAYGGDLWTPVI